MKVIESKYLPLPGFKAMNVFGLFLFVREGANMSSKDMNHEEIHSKQWRELLYVGFLLWYGIEYIVRLYQYADFHDAYRNISLEREAYANQENLFYLKNREMFDFLKYMRVNK